MLFEFCISTEYISDLLGKCFLRRTPPTTPATLSRHTDTIVPLKINTRMSIKRFRRNVPSIKLPEYLYVSYVMFIASLRHHLVTHVVTRRMVLVTHVSTLTAIFNFHPY